MPTTSPPKTRRGLGGWVKWLVLLVALALGAPAFAGASLSAAPSSPGYEHSLEAPPALPGGWSTEYGLYARVHAPDHDWVTARRLSRHATEAVPRIAEDLGVPAGRTMDIYIAPSERTFDAMQPGRPPEWADGTAWPHRGLIYLHTPSARDGTASPLEQVLDHEIVHVLLGRAFGPRPVPRWLQEGIAQIQAREYTPEKTKALAGGVLGDSLLSIEDITQGFPSDPIRAQLAYAQSADLIAFIQNTYGEEAVRTLIREMSRGRAPGASMRAATGLSIDAVDQAWRGEIESSLLWLQPLVSDEFLLGSFGLFFIGASIAALRRRKRRLDEWAVQEARQDAYADALRRRLAAATFEHPVMGHGDQPNPLDLVH